MPKTPSSAEGIATNARPTTAATPRPMRAATQAPAMLRSGLPAPRFCPAIVAAALIRPTEVQVISENSSV